MDNKNIKRWITGSLSYVYQLKFAQALTSNSSSHRDGNIYHRPWLFSGLIRYRLRSYTQTSSSLDPCLKTPGIGSGALIPIRTDSVKNKLKTASYCSKLNPDKSGQIFDTARSNFRTEIWVAKYAEGSIPPSVSVQYIFRVNLYVVVCLFVSKTGHP